MNIILTDKSALVIMCLILAGLFAFLAMVVSFLNTRCNKSHSKIETVLCFIAYAFVMAGAIIVAVKFVQDVFSFLNLS